jgi:hypothetical protein
LIGAIALRSIVPCGARNPLECRLGANGAVFLRLRGFAVNIFLLKLVVTPTLMFLVSRIARRWGGMLGGLVAGLPITSGPIVVFIGVEQGTAFAAQTAAGALSGLAAVLFTYFFYLCVSRRLGIAAACVTSLLFFAACSWGFLQIGSPLVALIAGLLAIVAVVCFPQPAKIPAEAEEAVRRAAQPSAWDIPVRMITATSMLLVITASAHILGPHLAGILSPIPVIAWPLTIFTHAQGGRREMVTVAKANAVSAVGVMVFYLIIRHLVEVQGLGITVTLALLASVVAAAGLGALLRRRLA